MGAKRIKAIVVTCGEGGHAEQMRRLLATVDGQHNVPYVVLAEGIVALGDITNSIIHQEQFKASRPKYSRSVDLLSPIKGAANFFAIFFAAVRILRTFDVELIVSTGPGVGIPVGIAGRLFGCIVIHLETWCRFSTRSITGRIMHTVATDFWIQHRSLAMLYPKSKFVGLL